MLVCFYLSILCCFGYYQKITQWTIVLQICHSWSTKQKLKVTHCICVLSLPDVEGTVKLNNETSSTFFTLLPLIRPVKDLNAPSLLPLPLLSSSVCKINNIHVKHKIVRTVIRCKHSHYSAHYYYITIYYITIITTMMIITHIQP